MRQHRMIGREIQLADDADRIIAGLHAGELDAVIGVIELAAGEMAEEIEMPPGPAKFAVGCELEADAGLLTDHLGDLVVLDLAQMVGGDLAFFQLRARGLDRCRPQQAADFIGAERGFGTLSHVVSLVVFVLPSPFEAISEASS